MKARAAKTEACYDKVVRFVFAAFVFAVTVAVVGCSPCRRVETTPIAVDCDQAAAFTGELHFDTADSYRNFLNDRCLLEASDEAIGALVDDVDFSTDAVFVARGSRGGANRCITERAAETVNVCEDGLRVVFADVETREECGGLWTVAFKLPRDELRAALE